MRTRVSLFLIGLLLVCPASRPVEFRAQAMVITVQKEAGIEQSRLAPHSPCAT